MSRCIALWVLIASVLLPSLAGAETQRLALIVGVNRSVDRSAADLRFADDDAARYFDLFEALGIQAVLVTRMDEGTRKLHAQAARAALEPRLKGFEAAVAQLASRARSAEAKGDKTLLYVVYAGHGNVEKGAGYIALEDARLTGKELETRLLGKVRAERTHFLIDACQSYFLAYARGPGGQRRKAAGFSDLGALGERSDVGVLLSTSSARESHEWARVQAGVFSHEVRSGLYGAADADRNGVITYREIAAFVARANATITNERYRPDVYARPPSGEQALLDLGPGLKRRVEIDGAASEHYLLEDQNGVYVAEFHNQARADVHLVRPRGAARLFVGRVRDGREFVIDADAPDVVRTAALTLAEPRSQTRGAAHEAFSRTFELPFGPDAVSQYRFRAAPTADVGPEESAPGMPVRRYVGLGLMGAGAIGASVGGVLLFQGHSQREVTDKTSQAEIVKRNREIDTANRNAAITLGLAGGSAAAGALLWFWPSAPVAVEVGPTAYGARVHGAF
jgi:hypothetical protein